jgi:Lactonase, 7-bladed beta-propeller
MNSKSGPRQFLFVVCLLTGFLALTLMIACGGSSNSSANNGSSSSSGSNNGSTGSSTGTNTGSTTGSSSAASGATYVYSAVYSDAGGIAGFKLDSSSGNMTAVPGSPFLAASGSAMGALAAVNGFVYTANRPDINIPPVLVEYKADASTGALTQVGTTDAGTTLNGDGDGGMRRLVVSPSGKNMYGVFQWTIVSYAIASDGTPSVLNATAPSTDSVWGFDLMPNGPYAYAAIQNGNPKQGFQMPELHLLSVGGDGTVTDVRSVQPLPNASGIAGDLRIDPSGKYVVVTNGQINDQLAVYAIKADGSLSEVPGSPFSTGSQNMVFMSFDSTGKYLYVLNNGEAEPRPQDIETFSFDPATGRLSKLQDLSLPNELMATWLTVDNDFVYVTNVTGGVDSTITTFKRDGNNGQLTQVGSGTVAKAIGQTQSLHF